MNYLKCYLLITLFAAGCGDAKIASEPEPLPTKNVVSNKVKGEASTVSQDKSEASPTSTVAQDLVDKETAQALLQRWLRAQNDGDFAQYEALYATRFNGVKRAGKRTFRFNRERWLKDRKGMFKRKMVVQVEDVKLESFAASAKIRFVQTWTSGKYSDKGPKEIFVTQQADGLRIYKEEMLHSSMAKRQGKIKPPDFLDQFYLVVDNRFAVIGQLDSTLPSQDATASGTEIAVRSLHPQHGQSLFRDHVVGGMYIGDAAGQVEKTHVTEVVGFAKAIPHFGTVQDWSRQKYTDAQIGTQIWNDAARSGGLYAAAVIESKRKKVLWAMRDLGVPPNMYASFTPTPEESETVLQKLLTSPKSLDIQRWFNKDGYEGKWYEYDAQKIIRGFQDKQGNRYIFTKISAGGGCGDFYEYISGFFNLTTDVPMALGAPDADAFLNGPFVSDVSPYVAMDIDGDGFPEFIGEEKLMYKSGDQWFVHELKIPYGDCPC